jgi:phage terminase small subunit
MARGRKSAASLNVVSGSFQKRPDPPEELSAGAKEVWRRTVASETPEFFRTAALQALLADYCRHVDTADILTSQIDAFEVDWFKTEDGVKRYDMLTKMRERETRSAADRATKLRLTNQSRYTPRAAEFAAREQSTASKPWEQSA